MQSRQVTTKSGLFIIETDLFPIACRPCLVSKEISSGDLRNRQCKGGQVFHISPSSLPLFNAFRRDSLSFNFSPLLITLYLSSPFRSVAHTCAQIQSLPQHDVLHHQHDHRDTRPGQYLPRANQHSQSLHPRRRHAVFDRRGRWYRMDISTRIQASSKL